MKNHFVLAHGACHGACCWYKLVTLLKVAGHRATALDLGGCGVNPRQLNEMASTDDYLQPPMEFMTSLPQGEKVILVGHSFGGIGVSFAMQKFPENILVAVFIVAYMPNCSSPVSTLIDEDLELAKMLIRPRGLFYKDLAKESQLTEDKFGRVGQVYVICEEEQLVKVEIQRWVIENRPPMLVKSILGADYMAVLSKPMELSLCLLEVAGAFFYN
ncbi:hypothetical protein Ancab_026040 [Ancistrocladus abbreviatus]